MDKDLLGCMAASWSPGAGGLADWFGVAPYALVGILCLRAVRPGAPDQNFWLNTGIILLVVALVKPFNLPMAVTAVGRCAALAEGWYGARRPIQAALVVVLVTAAAITGLAAVGMLHRALSRIWPALVGMVLLAVYVGIRAIDLHQIDDLLRSRIGPLPIRWPAEFGGLALIAGNAAVRRSRSNRRSRERERARAQARAPSAAAGDLAPRPGGETVAVTANCGPT